MWTGVGWSYGCRRDGVGLGSGLGRGGLGLGCVLVVVWGGLRGGAVWGGSRLGILG